MFDGGQRDWKGVEPFVLALNCTYDIGTSGIDTSCELTLFSHNECSISIPFRSNQA